jgi:hypothetical protein
VNVLRRIGEAVARFNRPLAGGTPAGRTGGLDQVENAERREFPPEEFPADEREENG